jgi:hypothetical protein
VETGFPKRSCSIKMLERQLIQSKTIPLKKIGAVVDPAKPDIRCHQSNNDQDARY